MPQRRPVISQLALALMLASCLHPSFAQAPLLLRVADHLPANHFLIGPLARYWMDSVTRATGGAVRFEHFPSEQLGKAKAMLTIAFSGTADMAGVVPSYISEKLPWSVVAELPGSFGSSCEGTLGYTPLVAERALRQLPRAHEGRRDATRHAAARAPATRSAQVLGDVGYTPRQIQALTAKGGRA